MCYVTFKVLMKVQYLSLCWCGSAPGSYWK